MQILQVTPGQQCLKRSNPKEIASATVTALLRTVPAAVPGLIHLFKGNVLQTNM